MKLKTLCDWIREETHNPRLPYPKILMYINHNLDWFRGIVYNTNKHLLYKKLEISVSANDDDIELQDKDHKYWIGNIIEVYWVKDQTQYKLDRVTYVQDARTIKTGIPTYYWLDRNYLYLWPTPEDSGTLVIHHYSKFPPLLESFTDSSGDNPTAVGDILYENLFYVEDEIREMGDTDYSQHIVIPYFYVPILAYKVAYDLADHNDTKLKTDLLTKLNMARQSVISQLNQSSDRPKMRSAFESFWKKIGE